MKRIIEWLRTKSSQPNTSITMDQSSADNGNLERDDYVVESSYGADVPNRIDSQGMDFLMPDIYADTQVDIKALDQTTPNIDEPAGFNPYDTGVLQKK